MTQRRRLDAFLVEQAQAAGVELHLVGGGLRTGSGSALEPTQAGAPATSPVVMGGGVYRDSTPVDVSSRAAAPAPLPRLVQAPTAKGTRGCSRWRTRATGTTASSAPDRSRQMATSPSTPPPSASHQPSTQSGETK